MAAYSRAALALFFLGAGTAHFVVPGPYLAIMPRWIPAPAALVAVSGAAEILGGLGVCLPATRAPAAWGLIALLSAVFPANARALSTGMTLGGYAVPLWMLWARLPLQLVFIGWVYQACLATNPASREAKSS